MSDLPPPSGKPAPLVLSDAEMQLPALEEPLKMSFDSSSPPAAQAAPTQPANAPHQWTRNKILAVVLVIIMCASLLTWIYPTITGNLALDIPQQNITNDTIPITQAITGLNVSGLLYGEGTAAIYFDTPNGTLMIATLTSDPGLPRTSKPSYEVGETVDVEHAPGDATYYFDDGTASAPVDVPFAAAANGTLLIVTPSDTYRLPIIIGSADRVLSFAECGEACHIEPTTGSIRIETTGSAAVELDSIDAAVLTPNSPPQQTAALPEQPIAQQTTLDLSKYFSDPDGDTLYYSTSASEKVTTLVEGKFLILTPQQNGEEDLTIYVSDLTELVPYTMHLTVTGMSANEPAPASNATEQEPANTTVPVEETAPTVPAAAVNTTIDCSNSNPNLLPEECLLANASEYFPEQDIYWENLDRAQVARFTIIGNLLLTGEVIEHSAGAPGARDFRIGYQDRDGETVPTIWIDSDGNLHLKGALHEENANLQPTSGSYSVLTKRSIYLAYAEVESGDLYVRGNVIPYRRSIS